MVFVTWSSPNHKPIKYGCPIKKTIWLTPVYLRCFALWDKIQRRACPSLFLLQERIFSFSLLVINSRLMQMIHYMKAPLNFYQIKLEECLVDLMCTIKRKLLIKRPEARNILSRIQGSQSTMPWMCVERAIWNHKLPRCTVPSNSWQRHLSPICKDINRGQSICSTRLPTSKDILNMDFPVFKTLMTFNDFHTLKQRQCGSWRRWIQYPCVNPNISPSLCTRL